MLIQKPMVNDVSRFMLESGPNFFIFLQHTSIYILLAWLGERVLAANVKGHNLCLLNQAAWERKRRIEASRETKILCLILSVSSYLLTNQSKLSSSTCLALSGWGGSRCTDRLDSVDAEGEHAQRVVVHFSRSSTIQQRQEWKGWKATLKPGYSVLLFDSP